MWPRRKRFTLVPQEELAELRLLVARAVPLVELVAGCVPAMKPAADLFVRDAREALGGGE